MKKKEWNEGLNHLDPDLVEKYVEQKDSLRQKSKKPKSVWLRFGAIAACFLLIVSAVIVVPMLREDGSGGKPYTSDGEPWSPIIDGPGIEPYTPNGEPWSPIINSNVSDIILSADKVGSVFGATNDSNGTNQYTEVYATSSEYLGIAPLPNAEYLPIYSRNQKLPSKNELNDFILQYWDSVTDFVGINTTNYEINKNESRNGYISYEAFVRENGKFIRFATGYNTLRFDLKYLNYNEKRLIINGERVSILESDTDEQIKEKLEDTISYVCHSFGKDYSDIKICREYSYRQLKTVSIYLYSPKETIFPLNFSMAPMTTDYISLTFNTDWGSGRTYHWGGSDEEAFLTDISLYQTSENWNDYYTVHAKAKMLTLEEAEKLLEKGYVFGGHSCPLCMAAQPEVDFSNYTYVDVEYISDENRELYIPFYAFYKYIGKSEHGIDTYAKTYVPAVQVSGYEEYFESQKDAHRNYGAVDEGG